MDVRTLFTGAMPAVIPKTAALTFDSTSIFIPSSSAIRFPNVTIYIERSVASPIVASTVAEQRAVTLIGITPGPNDTTSVAGILYRQPLVCDVTMEITRPISQKQVVVTSTLANRTSFPQLGIIGVAPVAFSNKDGKHTTTVTFNVADGGLTEYKLNNDKGTGTAATEAGNLTSTLLDAYGKQRQNNTELQQLKDANALTEERIKQLEDAKKYGILLTNP